MPQFGAVGFGTPNRTPGTTTPSTAVGSSQILPSPAIWGSCDGSSMRDNPDGFFQDYNFKDTVTAPGLPNQNGTWTFDTGADSAVNLAYTSTAIAAAFIRPLAPVSPQSGNKLWGEVSLNVKQSTAQHLFIGFATSTGLSSTLLASSTTLLTSTGLIGFWLHADAPTNFDAIYQNAVGGTPQTVLASVLTAGANNPDPGNPLFVPSTPPGALTGSQGYIKLGVSVLRGPAGAVVASFYVNGNRVAFKVLDSTFDTTDSYGFVIAAGTGTNNTDNVAFSFIRAAARLA
jgi:hypothetical protein